MMACRMDYLIEADKKGNQNAFLFSLIKIYNDLYKRVLKYH